MKLCPECSFVYEDHQRVCDMDGNLLVHDPVAALAEPQASAPTRLTISLNRESENLPVTSSAKRLPLLLILLVVLVSLLSVLAIAQVRRSRSSQAVQTPAPVRSAAPDTKPQAPATELASVAVTAVSEPLPDGPRDDAPAIPADPSSLKNARLSSNPVAAGAPVSNPRLVIVRLTNGAVINADEVWETKEGFWYRQSGMVTFLKRSLVTSIERLPPSRAPQKLAASSEERSKRSDNRAAQNQPRIARLEPEEKKPSRVKSFLKLTGRLLKKPFK